MSQKGGAGGRFTFTAAEAGDHRICFLPSSDSGKTAWLSTNNPNGGIKLTLDMTIGETSVIESEDKNKLEDIQGRIKDLNSRLQGIRRDQVFQRVGFLQIQSIFCIAYMALQSRVEISTVCPSSQLLTLGWSYRNERPNSATNPKLQTHVLSGGCLFNWLFSAVPAHGNFRICGLSSSSRS